MRLKNMEMFEKLGEYAFLACIIIAVIAGITAGVADFSTAWVALGLMILGMIVGFTTITEKEITPFLLAAIALTVASSGGWFLVINEAVAQLGTVINAIVFNITAFVAPAAIILATKTVYELAKKK
jgi:hypothetical protein